MWLTVSILAIVLAAPTAFLYLRQSAEPNPIHFEILEPGATQNNNTPVMSPDGQVAFIAGGGGDIHVTKDTGIGESTVLVNSLFTDIVQDWSKDGQYIAYLSEGAGSDGRRKSGLYVFATVRRPEASLDCGDAV